MFIKQLTKAFAIITLLAVNTPALSHDKVVVIPLEGGGIDTNQCEVSRRCEVATPGEGLTSTLSCPSGEFVLPCELPSKIVFVTSSIHQGGLQGAIFNGADFFGGIPVPGNNGGLAGGDAVCNARAAEAGLTGTFKAWLSSSTESVADRFTRSTMPYVNVNGDLIANNFESLIIDSDGDGDFLFRPIDVDENGTKVNLGLTTRAWTNTQVDGTQTDTDLARTCNDWTTAISNPDNGFKSGNLGDFSFVDSIWTNVGRDQCSSIGRLICFEQ